MNRNGLRQKAVPVAALLLALGAFNFQVLPAHAYLSDNDPGGEVSLDPVDPGVPGDISKHPGSGGGPTTGGGGGTDSRRADPDDLSFNNPRMDVPVVPVTTPSRTAWIGFLKLWLERFAAQFFLMLR